MADIEDKGWILRFKSFEDRDEWLAGHPGLDCTVVKTWPLLVLKPEDSALADLPSEVEFERYPRLGLKVVYA